jgi:multiple sugar transport system substrate-binding protein
MKKSIIRTGAAFCGLLILLASCGPAAPADKTKIRFATWDADDSAVAQKKLVDEYNASQSKVEVSLETYGDDFDTKIAAGMGAKDAPDVMYMWNYSLYQDGLLPLDSYVSKEGAKYKDNFFGTLLNYNSLDGKILGMPVGYTTHVVYFNKDLFDKAKVEYPKAGWTWDDLKAAAAKLTDKKAKIAGFAFSMKPDPYDFEMYYWSNGSSYLDQGGTPAGMVNGPAGIAVVKQFQDMLKAGIAIATDGSGASEMKTGKVAMFINGSWSIDSLRAAKINFGVAELPTFGAQPAVSVISTSGVSIYANSKHKDAAWDFVKFWTSEASNKARIGYELPVLKSVVDSQKIQDDPTMSVFYDMLDKSGGHTPASYLTKDWSKLSDKLASALEQAFNPTILADPKKVLDAVVE